MWTPSSPEEVVARTIDPCPQCGYPLGDLPPAYYHADMCEYYQFRNKAAEMGWTAIEGYSENITGSYLVTLFSVLNIPFKAFTIRGIVNSGHDIFVPYDVANAILLYSTREDFAGMTLEEFITRMCGDADTK